MGYTHDNSACLVKVTDDHARKATQKMRALRGAIWRFHEESQRVKGNCAPGQIIEIEEEDLDFVINALDEALFAIRILDFEVFEKSGGNAYRDLRDSHPQGGVVRGLTLTRNAATHNFVVLDPDLRALGLRQNESFIVDPFWKPLKAFPPGLNKNRTLKSSYKQHVAKRLVRGTLLDAFAFFGYCDPCVVERDALGKMVGFPLPSPRLTDGYNRLSPDWPDPVPRSVAASA